jgi:hypothetical protein
VDGAGAEVLQTTLLEAKIGDGALEGGLGHEGEVGGGVPEVLVEAGGEGGEEECVADLEAEVLELVGDRLEAQAVGVEGLVVLRCAEKFLLQEYDPLKLVVGEEPVDLCPHRASIVALTDDGLEDVRRDGEEEPADDGGVDGEPVGVTVIEEVDGAINVIAQVVLAEEEVEVRLPGVVVLLGDGELDGDVVGDGHGADHRGGRWSGAIEGGAEGVVGGDRRHGAGGDGAAAARV